MNRILAAVAVACALALAGCQTSTSAAGWGQIAAGAGQVIGSTKADGQVAKASAKLEQYCAGLRAVALSATLFAPERNRLAAQQAAVAVNKICDAPPADVASALKFAADAYAAAIAVRDGA